jgi:hypothetical protein
MNKQIITVADFHGYSYESSLASNSERNKKLFSCTRLNCISMPKTYFLLKNGNNGTIKEFDSLKEAIEAYNSL